MRSKEDIRMVIRIIVIASTLGKELNICRHRIKIETSSERDTVY